LKLAVGTVLWVDVGNPPKLRPAIVLRAVPEGAVLVYGQTGVHDAPGEPIRAASRLGRDLGLTEDTHFYAPNVVWLLPGEEREFRGQFVPRRLHLTLLAQHEAYQAEINREDPEG
jgi:hypothetical protein